MRIALRCAVLLFIVVALAVVVAPNLLTGPGVAQNENHLDWAFRLEQLALPVAALALLAALALTIGQWRAPTGLFGRAAMLLGVAIGGVALWGSTTTMSQQFFEGLEGGRYVAIDAATPFEASEQVLALDWKGQGLVYPIRIVGYHHIVNERLEEEPFVVTY